eukprot:COSAG05_NODE_10200_length_578_cov_0.789144_1_plen_31_part_01
MYVYVTGAGSSGEDGCEMVLSDAQVRQWREL